MSISEHSLSNITLHYVYDYSKADVEGLDAFIFNLNLLECLTSQDVEYVRSKMFSTLSDAMNINIPKFRLHFHQFPECFSVELRHRLKCLHTLYKGNIDGLLLIITLNAFVWLKKFLTRC